MQAPHGQQAGDTAAMYPDHVLLAYVGGRIEHVRHREGTQMRGVVTAKGGGRVEGGQDGGIVTGRGGQDGRDVGAHGTTTTYG